MKVLETPLFHRIVKKLNPTQKKYLDEAVKTILSDPTIGDPKKGDLAGIYVYKYRINSQNWLLAYSIESEEEIALRLVGPHENFYQTLKRSPVN